MKDFFGIYVMSFILCYVFLFLGGHLIFESLFAALALAALIIAVILTSFLRQTEKIEALQSRITSLEAQNQDNRAT